MTVSTQSAPSLHNNNEHESDAITVASASLEIEEIFNRCSETSYLEAVREWTDAKDLDESEVTKYLSDALIQKLTAEAINANLLKGKKLTSYTLDFLM